MCEKWSYWDMWVADSCHRTREGRREGRREAEGGQEGG